MRRAWLNYRVLAVSRHATSFRSGGFRRVFYTKIAPPGERDFSSARWQTADAGSYTGLDEHPL
jgi:hypothetical protein